MKESKNIIEKIWDQHVVLQKEGHPAIFAIDFQYLHEVTSSQPFDMLRERNLSVKQVGRHLATVDHSTPTHKDRTVFYDMKARKQVNLLRNNVEDFGVKTYDFESGHQGIVHIIGPELGCTQPGMTLVCGDSHTSTHGAFGAMAFGVGTTEVGLVMATGCILRHKPKTMKVEFIGSLQPGVYAKDAILALIAKIGVGGGNGHIIEYTGEAIKKMTMEERMTICNMSIECGARAGLIAPDQSTYDYLKGRKFSPNTASKYELLSATGNTNQSNTSSSSPEVFPITDNTDWTRALTHWKTLPSDPGATYDKEVQIDLNKLTSMCTWGTNPSQGCSITLPIPFIKDLPKDEQNNAKKALAYTGLKEGQTLEGTPIDWVFLGSCTNSRISDLRIAAQILKGKKIASNVKMFVVPGSEPIREQAKAEGLDQIFIEAGADWRQPGCSMCIAMNGDFIPSGERCLSTSNRNFVGRQGTGSITHLASPALAAASALSGKITLPPTINLNS
jgi:3-isopropylmalate/(R)-2-methylmalate dehydratase large subunit